MCVEWGGEEEVEKKMNSVMFMRKKQNDSCRGFKEGQGLKRGQRVHLDKLYKSPLLLECKHWSGYHQETNLSIFVVFINSSDKQPLRLADFQCPSCVTFLKIKMYTSEF
ncbi:hypothetical protein RRG08_015725 [Elysia crispata]|uniref:Uncharacterized protein n=1 Tax=Elysia crispata TaxID=231223 RepID=A0AAE0Z572_9GAST|nr:hypothetical protein RRG08_015725 [Elysia crispata]